MTEGSRGLESFKARLPLADLIGRYVKLIRRGREFVALCPFHQEKTPSFSVVPDKGFFHCFGCGASGNGIDFVMRAERLEFREAVRRVAEITGIPAPERGTPEAPQAADSLYRAAAAAAAWFIGRLGADAGAPVRAYLSRRGVRNETIRAFALGYAPAARDGLKRALLAEGFAEADLIEAGLLIVPEEGGPSFDRFRERVVFPIADRRGRVVGFGGRALGDFKPKYLNSPDGPLFHKGELLYRFHEARGAARTVGTLLVVEGYMDVIACAEAGLGHAVAPLGTALTEAQLALLWQAADEPVVCLDGDEAGLRAALRLAERALPALAPGRSLRFAVLPEGEDPDSLVRKGGRAALDGVADAALPLADFLWRRLLARGPLDTPEQRAALERDLRDRIATIRHPALRAHYAQELIERRFRPLFRPTRGAGARAVPPPAGGLHLRGGLRDPVLLREGRLLAPLLACPDLLSQVEEELAELALEHEAIAALRDHLLLWHSSDGQLDSPSLPDHLCRHALDHLARALMASEPNLPSDPEQLLAHWREQYSGFAIRAARRRTGAEMGAQIAAASAPEVRALRAARDVALNREGGS